jgi:hypothetical protein
MLHSLIYLLHLRSLTQKEKKKKRKCEKNECRIPHLHLIYFSFIQSFQGNFQIARIIRHVSRQGKLMVAERRITFHENFINGLLATMELKRRSFGGIQLFT